MKSLIVAVVALLVLAITPVLAQEAPPLDLKIYAIDTSLLEACNPCEEACPKSPWVKCAADYASIIADCFKPNGPCSLKVEVDPWTFDDLKVGSLYGAPIPVLTAMQEAIRLDYDRAVSTLSFEKVSDFCARALFAQDQIPPECMGQIGAIVLQHATIKLP